MKFIKTLLLLPLLLITVPAYAQSQDCQLSISADDMIMFDKAVLTAQASCESITLTLTHDGELPVTQMGHNWILAGKDDWEDIAVAGQAEGQQNEYVPQGDDRIIAHTSLVGGGESTSVTFDTAGLDPEKEYTYFCSFPGHYMIMNGSFSLES